MATKIQLRGDTEANWLSENPVLMEREFALVSRDPAQPKIYDSFKVGDGTRKFSEIPYNGLPFVQELGNSTIQTISQKVISDSLGIINVTKLFPLSGGATFATRTVARNQVPNFLRTAGLKLTYETVADGQWITEQFVGSTTQDYSNNSLWLDGETALATHLLDNSVHVIPLGQNPDIDSVVSVGRYSYSRRPSGSSVANYYLLDVVRGDVTGIVQLRLSTNSNVLEFRKTGSFKGDEWTDWKPVGVSAEQLISLVYGDAENKAPSLKLFTETITPIPFAEVLPLGDVQQMSASEQSGDVVFVKAPLTSVIGQNYPTFAFRNAEGTLFSNWIGRKAYMDGTDVPSTWTPKQRRLFYSTISQALYISDGRDLVGLDMETVMSRLSTLGFHIPLVNLTKTKPLSSGYYTLATALSAVDTKGRFPGLVITYQISANKWECYQFIDSDVSNWNNESKWKPFGAGGGGNVINTTIEYPLPVGAYYNLATAVASVEEDKRTLGLIVTFAVSNEAWMSYQYTGENLLDASWNSTGLWKEFGTGTGTIKGITINNGTVISPNSEGIANLPIDEMEVDETLDPMSTNPVENRAVFEKVVELEANTIGGSDVEIIDEENMIQKVTLTNKSGAEVTSFEVVGGGGGGEVQTTKIVLNAAVDKPTIKDGDSVQFTYFYDHQNVGGDDSGSSTGQRATIEITIRRGSVTVYENTIQDVSTGTYSMDITPYLAQGNTDIYVKATVIDPDTGNPKSKQAYASVRSLALTLSTSYDLAQNILGYSVLEAVTVPFTVNGTGTKIVTLYLDGVQYDTRTVTRSGTTNGSFNVNVGSLTIGRHTLQIVAEMEASNGLVIVSESVYFDFYRVGTSDSIRYIASKIVSKDGRIFDSTQHLTPKITVQQYETMAFDFIAYDFSANPAQVDIYKGEELSQTVSVARTNQVYTNRYSNVEEVNLKFVLGDVVYPFYVDVEPSEIDIEEVTVGMVLKLVAAGRSNTEENPGNWSYQGITTKFNNFDWDSNGWTGDSLKLSNGANIDIQFFPFATDPTSTGGTYMMEIMCSNVSDKTAAIIECMDNNFGFQVNTQEALIRSMGGSEVSTLFADNMLIQIAFVVRSKADNRLIELYVNGIRCGTAQYAADDGFLQSVPSSIKVNGNYADVEMRNIRAYNRALSDDEVLTNYMVDRPTGEEMVVLFEKNDVLTDDGELSIDMDKLRKQGKSVMRIVGNVELVNQTNDKKFEVPVDVYFYSAYGSAYNFVAKSIGLRIQGTSSTTYPRKNYRLYFKRSSKYPDCSLEVNGVNVPDFKYAFKPGSRPIDIFCMKADFAESSSTHNTGTAVLLNDVWKKCGYLTPPQAAYTGPFDVRTTVDGFPCDMWYDNNGTNVNVYLGKYNFNNEKSASGIIYGFEGIEGFNDSATLGGERNKCMCLEFLNNSEKLCLFQIEGSDFDSYAAANFDNALEFRFPEDTDWDSAVPEAKAAVKRLWEWVISCQGDYTKFAAEVAQYFDVDNLCVWYLYTEYFMAVDQRAKNMMLATWDEQKWYFIPYDCDTLFGVRNDGVLKYEYDIDENSWDDSIQSWCFAGHDSILWDLVRKGILPQLTSVAGVFRTNMSLSETLDMYNNKQMANWSERVYNKDGEFKYITPLTQGVQMPGGMQFYNYLYSLQGSRYAHRTFIIQNRFALLDAKYVVGTYRSEAFTAYFGYNFTADPRKIKIIASEKFYFGYGFTSGQPTVSAVPAESAGDLVELTMQGNLIVNDPQNIYGASRIRELDLRDVSMALLQTLNLNNCVALKKLDASCAATQTTLNNILVSNCKGLEEINISGLKSPNFTGMDITKNSRLRKFIASGASLTGVSFAVGAPLEQAVLPTTLQSLEMRSLKALYLEGLTFENAQSLQRVVVENCENLDWEALLVSCYNVQYLRVTGIEMEGDETFLMKYMSMGGVDENGANTPTCRLVGNYQLSSYVEDERFESYKAHYPELNIRQAEYTSVEFEDTVSTEANISNLDNKTGYLYGTAYAPSGHISKILSMRHGVLGKKTAEGEVTVFPLHDEDHRRFADSPYVETATPSDLTGGDGSVYIKEPRHWSKGVNDIRNGKKYAFYSTNETMKKVEGLKILSGDIPFVNGYALRTSSSYKTLEESKTQDSYSAYGIVNLRGYKRVRVPGVASAVWGALFLDNSDSVISSFFGSSENGMAAGMYIFSDVPEGATKVAFTIDTRVSRDFVWLTNSLNIADVEPDWVLNEEVLIGAFEAVAEDGILRTKSEVQSSASLSWSRFNEYADNMGNGFSLIDYNSHKRIGNLFFVCYGRKNSQMQCGYGDNNYNRSTGLTARIGMNDTNNPDGRTEGAYYQGSNLQSSKCMGYENWHGHKYEMMSGIMYNKGGVNSRWTITNNDGTERVVQGLTIISAADYWVNKVRHQRDMDLLVVNATAAGSSTYYCDSQYLQNSSNRVVYRSCNSALASGGVSYLHANYDSSIASAHRGTRVAFKGRIREAQSVTAFRQLDKLD